MLTRRVIPCLDVRDGRVVKGVRFAQLRDIGDPAELAHSYQRQGADELVMLDVSATLEARLAGVASVRRIREQISIPLTVGGGVQDIDDAARLLDAGADRVSVNSAAVARPSLISDLASRFGSQCVVIAIDAERCPATQSRALDGALAATPQYRVAVRSATQALTLNPFEWARRAASLGAGEVLLTSIDRDGTGSGYDIDLTRGVAACVPIPVIASGGARSPLDLCDVLQAGADAVLVASMVHDGLWSIEEIKTELMERGVPMRQKVVES